MSVLRYTRFAAAVIFVLMCGFPSPACFADARAVEYDDFSYQAIDFASASVAALELPTIATRMRSREPFDLAASAPVKGGIQNKWRSVTQRLPREHAILTRCRIHAAACPPAAQRFLAVIDRARTYDGWARIAELNRAINLDIKPVDDMTQYGVVDLWATPLMAFKSNEGDCEDYAIAKYVALRELGIPSSDLRLIVVHINGTTEDHAVAAVRYDGNWLVLDNRTLEMRQDADIANYDPLFVIDGGGVKRVIAWGMRPRDTDAHVDPAALDLSTSSDWHTAQLLLWGLNDWLPGSGQSASPRRTTHGLRLPVWGRVA